MIRLSRIIKDIKEIRMQSNSVISQANYFIVAGEKSELICSNMNQSINNCLYLEQYLRLSVSNACSYLDGFDKREMDPVDYISSSDVKNKYVDICRGRKVVATIDLSTGDITRVNQSNSLMGKEKSPAEKS